MDCCVAFACMSLHLNLCHLTNILGPYVCDWHSMVVVSKGPFRVRSGEVGIGGGGVGTFVCRPVLCRAVPCRHRGGGPTRPCATERLLHTVSNLVTVCVSPCGAAMVTGVVCCGLWLPFWLSSLLSLPPVVSGPASPAGCTSGVPSGLAEDVLVMSLAVAPGWSQGSVA